MEIAKISKEKAWELRHKVMWPDKPFDFIKLEDDDIGMHYGFYKNKKLISVVSLFIDNGEGQFRKFATLQTEQGKGYGSALLHDVIKEAKQLGLKRIWCNARKNKVDFYKKFGLKETDGHFTRGGKSYIIMDCDL
ncbi:GNAT family N-acetyltransferase [Oceanobacillus piezotolerans]|uniref:GNAT family N-acetyltransferase n=1 Tax=Oceanobacillus piezotolerans TaxID=2448030 RepID=A0A498D8S1_9BACI|nr:GNAT family N-acetyltransferase [Oceanobacillus piezotolerans]RLL47125.1 GNAT family N-acetyltransferase [Oceanobacillus piezotolerans]